MWSGIGLHLHVSVRKKTPLGFDPDGAVYHSDAIEVFLANVEDPTNVIADDHAVHQILGPASSDGGQIGVSGPLLAEDYTVVLREGAGTTSSSASRGRSARLKKKVLVARVVGARHRRGDKNESVVRKNRPSAGRDHEIKVRSASKPSPQRMVIWKVTMGGISPVAVK